MTTGTSSGTSYPEEAVLYSSDSRKMHSGLMGKGCCQPEGSNDADNYHADYLHYISLVITM